MVLEILERSLVPGIPESIDDVILVPENPVRVDGGSLIPDIQNMRQRLHLYTKEGGLMGEGSLAPKIPWRVGGGRLVPEIRNTQQRFLHCTEEGGLMRKHIRLTVISVTAKILFLTYIYAYWVRHINTDVVCICEATWVNSNLHFLSCNIQKKLIRTALYI